MRRDFPLPEDDIEYLDACGHNWQTVADGVGKWVIVNNYPVPPGYNTSVVNVALKIDPGYPVAQIDMVYFYPALARLDGRPIAALTVQPINGSTWQRWSRHRTGENPWRPGLDGILTHLKLVDYWMEREIRK